MKSDRNDMQNEYRDLGPHVRELRIRMDLTQMQVAEALHVTPGYICNVEGSRTAMSLRMLLYYAKLTGVTLDSLVGQIVPEYRENAVDNALQKELLCLSSEEKQKLLRTLQIWKQDNAPAPTRGGHPQDGSEDA